MSIPTGSLPHSITVTHRTAGTPDEYGNEVIEDGTTETLRGRVDIASTGENLTDRNEQRERFDVILTPPAAPIEPLDRLTWEDEAVEMKLDGPAAVVYDSATPHHVELVAYRTRG